MLWHAHTALSKGPLILYRLTTNIVWEKLRSRKEKEEKVIHNIYNTDWQQTLCERSLEVGRNRRKRLYIIFIRMQVFMDSKTLLVPNRRQGEWHNHWWFRTNIMYYDSPYTIWEEGRAMFKSISYSSMCEKRKRCWVHSVTSCHTFSQELPQHMHNS